MSSPPRPGRPPSALSRARSTASQRQQHMPAHPSGLRESHEAGAPSSYNDGSRSEASHSPRSPPLRVDDSGIVPLEEVPTTAEDRIGVIDDMIEPEPDARTALLGNQLDARTSLLGTDYYRTHAHPGPCNHGTFSPRPGTRQTNRSYEASIDSRHFGGRYPGGIGDEGGASSNIHGVFGDAVADGVFGGGPGKKMSTTQWLAKKHGVKNTRAMYLAYYIPFLNWITQYKWSYLQGDIIAALTMASFYIPMSLSYAANLGHIPPINGLYSFVFNPLIYAFLGSSAQMVVGPEAAGSLLVGTVVRTSVDNGNTGDDDDTMNARVAGVVTGMAGCFIFIAGLTRLGFLDSVLSRPFLRGFISAIGFVIVVDQLIPELGLSSRASEVGGISHGSSITKIAFLISNISHSHKLTAAVSLGSFAIIMILRELKKRLQPRYPSVAYVPDRFLVVVLSAVFTWKFGWEKKGLPILGEIKPATGNPFPFHWPFQNSHMTHVRQAMSTSFLIGLLGFFESSVAAKSLSGGTGQDAVQGMTPSANRELIALGVANMVGGCFMALPAFGGYGRSKVNAATGGKTPMSSLVLSLISIICVLFMLPYFYYLPKGVLSAMISVVAYSLIEEAPPDIRFFLKIRGWSELGLMFIIFTSTIFYSLPLGIAIGVGVSIISVIRHSTRPRIQILGRVPGTDKFESAEDKPEALEFVEGCLIVKIPEPLTFANTGELKTRLKRLELYGTTAAHPALPRVRHEDHNKNIIFDVHGVTSIDGSGTQVLAEIIDSYVEREVRVFFCRVPSERSQVYRSFERAGIIEACGGTRHFVASVEKALEMTDLEDIAEGLLDEGRESGEQG